MNEFGVYAEDLTVLCEWLLSYGITSVAMESTGYYWQNLYAELMKHGIEVILCNGKFTKYAKGKKTDVKDCRHIQKLHALGLLTSSFLPDETTRKTEDILPAKEQLDFIGFRGFQENAEIPEVFKFLLGCSCKRCLWAYRFGNY